MALMMVKEFAHARHQRDLGRFTGGFQSLVELTNGWIESYGAYTEYGNLADK